VRLSPGAVRALVQGMFLTGALLGLFLAVCGLWLAFFGGVAESGLAIAGVVAGGGLGLSMLAIWLALSGHLNRSGS
jgi:hypothetical protein